MPAAAPTPETQPLNRGVILLAVCLGAFMATLDTSIVNIALPQIAQDFQGSLVQISWVMLIYLLMNVSLLLTSGRLGDLLAPGKLFLLGVAIFTVASALCGLSPNLATMIASRALQGLGASLMLGIAPKLIALAYGEGERGLALGLFSTAFATGISVGAPLGGLITAYLGWPFIFFINLPIGAGIFWVSGRVLRPIKAGKPWSWQSFDLLEAVVLAGTLGFLLLGLTRGQQSGWSAETLVALGLAALLGLSVLCVALTPDGKLVAYGVSTGGSEDATLRLLEVKDGRARAAFNATSELRGARAVLAARGAGAKVLMGGACSTSNTRDKLFPDGSGRFLPWLDFVSIHYQPLAADAVELEDGETSRVDGLLREGDQPGAGHVGGRPARDQHGVEGAHVRGDPVLAGAGGEEERPHGVHVGPASGRRVAAVVGERPDRLAVEGEERRVHGRDLVSDALDGVALEGVLGLHPLALGPARGLPQAGVEDGVVGELVAARREGSPFRQALRERLRVPGQEEGAPEAGRAEVRDGVVEVGVHAVVVGEDDRGLHAARPGERTGGLRPGTARERGESGDRPDRAPAERGPATRRRSHRSSDARSSRSRSGAAPRPPR